MPLSRRGSGVAPATRALASQVHPVFMLPPVACSLFGGVLAGAFAPLSGALHATAIFAAVYTAHVKDGYVDFHVRGEDDDHPLTERGCKGALAASTALFFACLGGLWLAASPGAALLTLPTWLVAYHHAPQLDTNPVTATTGYPLGIALSILGGYYAQADALGAVPLAFAAVFLVLLSGVKVIDDAQDFEYDRSIDKRTVAVALGPRRARTAAYALMTAALVLVVGFAALAVFPPSSVAAVAGFGAVALAARRADPTLATMLLVRGSYVFLALLLVAVWFRPLA
ncbi:UbiA family prenyltransferase [Halorussus salilacus]|uniref:UbiA family prenyltransferase n=1 Tax=Halorussus salilacus TaxID=2953750 RepID=UPI00209E974B|nr:UbiA family prenyltransferase [Halorussus salilacus]USZ68850.1 UbiA family prenyltransferase [Halorussus salilacus]